MLQRGDPVVRSQLPKLSRFVHQLPRKSTAPQRDQTSGAPRIVLRGLYLRSRSLKTAESLKRQVLYHLS
jgi:hypothetical protein